MNKLKIFGAVAILLATTSCDKNFEEINTNPNGLEQVLPKSLLAPAITKVVGYNMDRSQRVTNELMQVTVNMGDGEGRIFRYEIRTSEADYLWNNWYLQIKNFKDIYKFADELKEPNYMGVSLICQAWVFSMLTDTYGDIPYFEAAQATENNFRPKFDSQEAIYVDLISQLDKANDLLKTAANIDGSSDPIYNGNVQLWRKFANSLQLRLLMRISNKTAVNVPQKVKEIVETNASNYPLISNNAESAILRWSGESPYVSPFNSFRDGDWIMPKLSNFFVDYLNESGDPRLQTWATAIDGEYQGIPSGYPIGQAPVAKSTLPVSLKNNPLLGNILNYAELQFILAEASLKGWITTNTAQYYYEKGATEAIQLWSFEVPSDYFDRDVVIWNESYSFSDKMNLIFKQKYYSLFFTDLQSWFEYRRSGYPILPIGPGHMNNGMMPARLNYPVYIQAANKENYQNAVNAQGPDNINTLVWWQKP